MVDLSDALNAPMNGGMYAMKYRDEWIAKRPEDFVGYKNRWRGPGSQKLNMQDMLRDWLAGKEFSEEDKKEYMEFHRVYNELYRKK